MELTFTKNETAVLLTHMSIMRRNMKKGLKKTYRDDWKDKVDCYESIIKDIKDAIVTDLDYYTFNMKVDKVQMIYSFITWYVKSLNDLLNNKKKLNEGVINVLATLEEIEQKIKVAVAS